MAASTALLRTSGLASGAFSGLGSVLASALVTGVAAWAGRMMRAVGVASGRLMTRAPAGATTRAVWGVAFAARASRLASGLVSALASFFTGSGLASGAFSASGAATTRAAGVSTGAAGSGVFSAPGSAFAGSGLPSGAFSASGTEITRAAGVSTGAAAFSGAAAACSSAGTSSFTRRRRTMTVGWSSLRSALRWRFSATRSRTPLTSSMGMEPWALLTLKPMDCSSCSSSLASILSSAARSLILILLSDITFPPCAAWTV